MDYFVDKSEIILCCTDVLLMEQIGDRSAFPVFIINYNSDNGIDSLCTLFVRADKAINSIYSLTYGDLFYCVSNYDGSGSYPSDLDWEAGDDLLEHIIEITKDEARELYRIWNQEETDTDTYKSFWNQEITDTYTSRLDKR